MITIPTTELIGCLNDVLPHISDPKSEQAGVKLTWDGDRLIFTVYDVHSGIAVEWVPGEGAEGDMENGPEGSEWDDDIAWGGDDAPWSTWVWLPHAKEILKLFKLPAKLWRVPVSIKCSPTGDRLIFEREDGPTAERLLTVPAAPDKARSEVPDVGLFAERQTGSDPRMHASFEPARLGAFGQIRPHGALTLSFGANVDEPVHVRVGPRATGFIYLVAARNVRPYRFLRDAAGVAATGKTDPADQAATEQAYREGTDD